MKPKLFVILCFIVLSAPNVFSQSPVLLSIGTGISGPMSESNFSDAFNLGFNVHASATVLLNRNIGFRGDLQYNNFSYDESSPDFSASYKITSLKADLLAGNFEGKVNPYGVVGMGVYFQTVGVSDDDVTISQSTTDFGMGLGGGLSFSVSPAVNLYGEAQYNFIFTDGAAKGYLPFKFGASFKIQ